MVLQNNTNTTAAAVASPGKVICAMSGGVDSSVTAKLLVDAGYEVIGVTMKLFENEDAFAQPTSKTCCSLSDVEDARSVATNSLGIPYYVYNYKEQFRCSVMDTFCNEYLAGRTPNPCIDCNAYLKFAELQKLREELGFDYVATGHYVRRKYDTHTKRYFIERAKDPKKDQSYVLYQLTQETLQHMLFPLGNFTKEEVRAIAEEAGLRTSHKQESQDICFVPDGNYANFIERHTGKTFEPGPIVTTAGKVLGQHAGLVHYTLGQRKGLGVAAGVPLYVLDKQVATNTLVVGPKSELGITRVAAERVTFISGTPIEGPFATEAKVNYRARPQAGIATYANGVLEMVFNEPLRSAAPGQALVLYDGNIVLGGGVISQVFRN